MSGMVRVNRVDLARVYDAVGSDMVKKLRHECEAVILQECNTAIEISRKAVESLLAYADNFGGSFDLETRDAEERLRNRLSID